MGDCPALGAAQEWLAFLDAGDYPACWSSAAALMRSAVPEEQFTQTLRAALAPMGTLLSRAMTEAESHETLPGAPDGRYWVVCFAASYTNKKAAVETVTATWDGDAWRVSGYYLR